MLSLIRKFKFFFSPVIGLTKWLNKMSDEGYRLMKVGNIFFYFDECEKGKYRYAVDYVANKSYSDLKDYESFLQESNIRCIEKQGSIGKVSFGNIRWRPFADKGAKIATSNGMIKREFLILEKENDGNPFEIYTTIEDKINALKIMRRPTITMIIFAAVMLIFANLNIETLSFKGNKMAFSIFIGVVGVISIINLLRFNLEIKRLEKDSFTNE